MASVSQPSSQSSLVPASAAAMPIQATPAQRQPTLALAAPPDNSSFIGLPSPATTTRTLESDGNLPPLSDIASASSSRLHTPSSSPANGSPPLAPPADAARIRTASDNVSVDAPGRPAEVRGLGLMGTRVSGELHRTGPPELWKRRAVADQAIDGVDVVARPRTTTEPPVVRPFPLAGFSWATAS